MKLDFSKEVKMLHTSWDNAVFARDEERDNEYFSLWGPRGSGKTKIAQDYVRSHANAVYLSFDKMTYDEAVEMFCRLYVLKAKNITTMKDAAAAFIKSRVGGVMIILENEHNQAHDECDACFTHYAIRQRNVKLCNIEGNTPHYSHSNHVEVKYRTLADFRKMFQDYTPQEVLRIHAMTGGIPEVISDLDAEADVEENISRMLSYDSAFSNLLPRWLAESFRTPESYYPIIRSIAGGHHRLSEIAKDIGFPNNKCGTYLQAMIEKDFVCAKKPTGSKQATYDLANSYFIAWGRYACGKKMQQIAAPDMLKEAVLSDMDDNLCLPAFYMACEKYIEEAWKGYLLDFHVLNRKGEATTKRSVPVKLRDGSEVILDYVVRTKEESFIFVMPHSVDFRYSKNEMKRVFEAIEIEDSLYYTHITVFSIERFSDWCVHQASVDDWLHEVTLERLRY